MAVAASTVGLIQLGAGLLALVFLKPALDNWGSSGSKSFALFVVAIAIWSFGLAGSNFSGSLQGSVWAYTVGLLGAELAAVGWLLLSLAVTSQLAISRRVWAPLAAWVVLMQVAFWTNPLHGLALTGETALGASTPVLLPVYGPLFWIHAVVGYLLVLTGLFVLVVEAATTTGLRRKQTTLFALSVLPLLAMNVLALADLTGPYDLTQVGFLLTAILFALVRFRGRFLDITPVARRTAMAVMQDAVVTLDDENRVVDFNQAAAELFADGSAAVGMPATAFFARVDSAVIGGFETADDAPDTVGVRVNDEQRYFSVSIQPLEGATERWRVVVLHDITARKQYEKGLEHRNERLDQFASLLSHELRNPLMITASTLELVEDELPAKEADRMRTNLGRMDEMIDELLAMARARQTVEDTEPVVLAALAREAWTHQQADGGELAVAVDEGVTVEADPDQLSHVFENLFRNAKEHNEGPVAVRVEPLDSADGGSGTVGFAVEDDGQGIPLAERETVFEQGYTTDADGGGTGLGLALVHDIIEAHGWQIRVSDGEDGGARFEVLNAELSR